MFNVFYIHTHDSGKIFSPYGFKVPSASIEDFSEKGIMFRNAFSTSPTCSPSRGSLLTGLYPSTHGMIGLCNRNFKLNDQKKHLAHFLSSNGYETVLCGIQHEASHYKDSMKTYGDLGYQKNISCEKEVNLFEDKREYDDQNTKKAISWLEERNSNKPLFLSFGFFGTHRPFPIADKNYKSKPPNGLGQDAVIFDDFNNYCSSMENVDKNFGKLMELIEKKGYLENSIIIFTSDHGIGFPFAKSNLFDTGTAVALMVYDPRMKLNNRVSDALVSQVDIFPTLCDLLSLEKPDWLQGKSFAEELLTTKDIEGHDVIYTEMTFHTTYEPARAVRTKRYKLIKYLDEDWLKPNLSNINQSETKDVYIENGLLERSKENIMLFDLLYDPDEKSNVANSPEYKNIKDVLLEELEKHRVKYKDPLLDSLFKWENDWIINKKESVIPSSKNRNDYYTGHEPK